MRQVWWWSVTMDTRYDVINSRWSSHFWVKMHVFQLLSGIKEKRLDKMMQSNYVCVVLLVRRKKLLIVTRSRLVIGSCYHCFYLISSSWKWNARWRPCLVTSQTASGMTLCVRPSVKPAYNREWREFGMGLLIIKSTCYSSWMRGAGVSTQQFSTLQENKISVQTNYAI